jgi:hypothetical protein
MPHKGSSLGQKLYDQLHVARAELVNGRLAAAEQNLMAAMSLLERTDWRAIEADPTQRKALGYGPKRKRAPREAKR